MLENVDEFLLCRPYARIWALVVDRIRINQNSSQPYILIGIPLDTKLWNTLLNWIIFDP